MDDQDSLQSLEKTAYRRAYSDGIIEIFVGLSLLWIGSVWIFLPDYGGLSGVLPAIFTPSLISVRKKYVEDRLGFVRWSEPRRNKERRNLAAMAATGVVLFIAGIVAFFAVENRSLADQEVLDFIAPSLLAWLLALVAVGLALLVESWRILAYAAVLAMAGLVTGVQEANPGWPLLAAGVVTTIGGSIMLVHFSHDNPRPENT